MAVKVTVQQLGSTATKTVDNVSTVAAALSALGITGKFAISINGEPASMDSSLSDFAFISLGEATKGGVCGTKKGSKSTAKPSKGTKGSKVSGKGTKGSKVSGKGKK